MAKSISKLFFIIFLSAPILSFAQVADYNNTTEKVKTCNLTEWKKIKDTICSVLPDNDCADPKPDMNIAGIWRVYSTDTSRVVAIIGVKAKRLNGQKITYHDNGTWEVSNYNSNLLKGVYTSYYKNGKPELTGQNIANEPVGTWIGYWENGNISYETFYDKSSEYATTKQKFYNKEGKKTSQEEWNKLRKASK